MTKQLQAVRGTKDIYPSEYRYYRFVTDTAERIGQLYGFEGMMIPIIEFTDVFKRTLGEGSDVVGKEMYVFEDKGGESLCLRPEFTAGVVRSFITSGLTQHVPLKLYTTGPVFRYERPQKGRQRQFHQINFEAIGSAGPDADIEIIALGAQLVEALGVSSFIKLEINSLGDDASRQAYRTDLVTYFERHVEQLSADSQMRLQRNPLRILDSKDEGDKKIVAGAPKINAYYTPEAAAFFERVTQGLDTLGISYTINPNLVRGLDYYCHTAFEFTTTALGSHNAVLAGGRYDKLVEMMGGPAMPSVGFAGGVERLVGLLEQAVPVLPTLQPVAVIPVGEAAERMALTVTQMLRQQGIYVELFITGALKKRMKKADQKHAVAVVIIGDEEISRQRVKLKHMQTGTEEDVSIEQLVAKIKG